MRSKSAVAKYKLNCTHIFMYFSAAEAGYNEKRYASAASLDGRAAQIRMPLRPTQRHQGFS